MTNSFKYTFEAADYANGGTTAAEAPTIDGVTIKPNSNVAGDATSADFEGAITLPEASEFPHAGIYKYTVAETNSAADDVAYSQATYAMYVYVENDPAAGTDDPDTTIKVISNVSFVQLTDFEGEEPEEETKDSADFTNVYDPKSNLIISKQVTGAYGDKTKDFTISIVVTLPANYTADATKDYYTAPESLTAAYTVKRTESDHTSHEDITLTKQSDGTYKADLILADGETVEIDGLPVGATYTLEETAVNNYTPTYTYAATDAKGATIAKAIVGATEDKNTGVVTNDYTPVTPTGILISNLPYILLIGIPVAALVAWLVIRGKRYSQAA